MTPKLQAALAAADESYLIGLSNKGTVNRAKKDLLKESPVTQADGTVTFGGETITLTAPLGQSTCTCPSTAMCRHRIAVMLYWMEGIGQAPEAPPEFPSLRAYPPEKLAKQLGTKRLLSVLTRHQNGEGPEFETGSILSAELSWHGVRVRLLEPLEHSTCSCHSQSFCIHRAEALLHWQLQQGIAKAEVLMPKLDGPDPEQLRAVCGAVRELLEGQLRTGLSRMPASVCDSAERMAGLCHTAGLADLERALRRLHGEYEACFVRSATFRDGQLLSYLSHAYRLAVATETAAEADLPKLLGTFREEYGRVGERKLCLLGWREHHGRGGYAGTIYYFYEVERREFYTFSDIWPTFYGNIRRGSPAPWGLNCTLKEASQCLLQLQNAKLSGDGNLSATQECRATLIGPRKPWELVEEVVTDFEALLPLSAPNQPEVRTLALLRPARWERREFDRVRQVFAMDLYDSHGRDISLEVRYRKEEAPIMDHLEKIRPGGVFLVRTYREGDRLKCYPIEYFEDWREDHGSLSGGF